MEKQTNRQSIIPYVLQIVPRPGDREIFARPFPTGTRIRNQREENIHG